MMDWRQLMGADTENEHLELYTQKEQKGGDEGAFATIATIADKGQKLKNLDAEARYRFEERAAIMEYDGGLSRTEAEKMATEKGRISFPSA